MEMVTSNKPEAPASPAAGDPSVVAMRVDEIRFIRLIGSAFEFPRRHMAGGEVVPLNIHDHAATHLDGRDLVVQIKLTLRLSADADATQESEESGDLLRIRGEFELAYRLSEGDALSEADLMAFAHVNGMMNAVPYWREFVSSTLVRAGLPSYEVPPFNPFKIASAMRAKSKPAQEPAAD
jgi:hypothetical protein